MIAYREAELGDAAALASFARDRWLETFGALFAPVDCDAYVQSHYSEALQRKEIADDAYHYRLAFADDELVGYCWSGRYELPLPVTDRAFELHRIYLIDSAKRAGIGYALTEDAIRWAQDRGGEGLYLSVWENNHRAQAFYCRNSFTRAGEHTISVGETSAHMLILRRALK